MLLHRPYNYAGDQATWRDVVLSIPSHFAVASCETYHSAPTLVSIDVVSERSEPAVQAAPTHRELEPHRVLLINAVVQVRLHRHDARQTAL